jgi:hypothetical protein
MTAGVDVRPGHEYRRERLIGGRNRLMQRRQWALLRNDMATLSRLDRQLEDMSKELKKSGKAWGRESVRSGVRRERVIQKGLKNRWSRRPPTIYRYR